MAIHELRNSTDEIPFRAHANVTPLLLSTDNAECDKSSAAIISALFKLIDVVSA